MLIKFTAHRNHDRINDMTLLVIMLGKISPMVDGHNMAEDFTLVGVIGSLHQSPIQLQNCFQSVFSDKQIS